jgi:Tfp pilus assembly protein PilF
MTKCIVHKKEPIRFKEHFKSNHNLYQVETYWDEEERFIILHLFKNKKLVFSRRVAVSPQDKKEEITPQVRELQRVEMQILRLLFAISKKIRDKSDGTSHNSLGLIFLSKELLEEAKEQFLSALVKAPNFSEAYSNLGVVYLKLGMPDDAIKALETALKLDSKFPDFYNNLGHAFVEKKMYPEAEEQFQKALDLNPNYQEVYLNLGFCCLDRADYEGTVKSDHLLKEALQYFEKAHKGSCSWDKKLDALMKKASNWEDLSRIYMYLRSQLTEGSSLQIRSLCNFYTLHFKYDHEVLDKKSVEYYLKQLSQEIASKNFPDLKTEFGIAYLFYALYFLNLAKEQFLKARSLPRTRELAVKNLIALDGFQSTLNKLLQLVIK